MSTGHSYLGNVAIGFVLCLGGMGLADLIPHPRVLYGLLLGIGIIPVALFVQYRTERDSFSVAMVVIVCVLLGAYVSAMGWLVDSVMNIDREYSGIITALPLGVFFAIFKRSKRKA
jgi:hypothetical protein